MNLQHYFKNITIDVAGNTIFIKSKTFDFCYTPANDIVKDEYKDQYRYFGGLQCEFEHGSKDYEKLESKLCDIAEAVLDSLSTKKAYQYTPQTCPSHIYSRGINEPRPRLCQLCGSVEPNYSPCVDGKHNFMDNGAGVFICTICGKLQLKN
jgi:hypothetical protein